MCVMLLQKEVQRFAHATRFFLFLLPEILIMLLSHANYDPRTPQNCKWKWVWHTSSKVCGLKVFVYLSTLTQGCQQSRSTGAGHSRHFTITSHALTHLCKKCHAKMQNPPPRQQSRPAPPPPPSRQQSRTSTFHSNAATLKPGLGTETAASGRVGWGLIFHLYMCTHARTHKHTHTHASMLENCVSKNYLHRKSISVCLKEPLVISCVQLYFY